MKKLYAIFVLLIAMTAPAMATQTTLLAGQTMDVGTVDVTNDGTNLYVDFDVTGDWEILGTHLYVGKTNPDTLTTAPGQFPYKDDNPYTIALDDVSEYMMEMNKKGNPTGKMIAFGDSGVDVGEQVWIAAHADLRKLESITYDELITNGGFETPEVVGSWIVSNDVPGWTTAPNVLDTEGDPEGLELQKGLFGLTAPEGDQWVELDAYYPLILSQNVEACPSGEYVLSYTYAPRPGTISAMSVSFGSYAADHNSPAAGWTTVTEEVAGPTEGTLDIVFTETGPNDQLGMLLDDVSVQCREYNYLYESAWAEGFDFTHPNWAMYFGYNWDVSGDWLLDFGGANDNREFVNLVQDGEDNVAGEFWYLSGGNWLYGGTLEGNVSGNMLYLYYERPAPLTYTGEFYGVISGDMIVNGEFTDSSNNKLFWTATRI